MYSKNSKASHLCFRIERWDAIELFKYISLDNQRLKLKA